MSEVLQEYFDSRGLNVKVDAQEGVLHGVKLLGLESRNGRRYQETALDKAQALYEGAKVNVNHPKDGPLSPRDYQDRLGVIRNVEFRTGQGLFGDLHFNPKHNLAEQLLWDAEHNPRNVGFSHNVMAKLSRKSDAALVEEITHVQSVDLVADPATTQGLFESMKAPEASGAVANWDALTIETLELHRPDLLQEIRTANTALLHEQIEEADRQILMLRKREQIGELLSGYGLSIQNKNSIESENGVSSVFVEMLMSIQSEEQIEKLIAERASLINVNSDWSARTAPQSRDQLSFVARGERAFSSCDFASSLKS